MSEELLVHEARRRAEVFRNLPKHFRKLLDAVREVDEKAEVYLFGSVVEGKHLLSSDIDVLVVTSKPAGEVLARLWSRGIKDPFEIHVVTGEMLDLYKRRAKLVKASEFIREALEGGG